MTKDPPHLPPEFPEKNIRLKFNLFLVENTHNCVYKMLFLISIALAKLNQKFYHIELRKERSKNVKK